MKARNLNITDIIIGKKKERDTNGHTNKDFSVAQNGNRNFFRARLREEKKTKGKKIEGKRDL